jgi:TrmH family RNA methyltransferase
VFNPKVVRASAGALFRVPVVVDVPVASWPISACRCSAPSPPAACPTTRPRSTAPARWCSAAKPTGCPPTSYLDGLVSIPHAGRAESLNVAMAATVLCFEVARRRRHGSASP